MIDITLIEPLTPAEVSILEQCEIAINSHYQGFIKAAEALVMIRDRQLYRQHYTSFDAYLRERWHFGESRARQLINAAPFAQQIEAETGVALPTEAVVREAKKYGERAAEVVLQAVGTGKPLTAPLLQQAAAEIGATTVNDTDVSRQKVYETKCAPLIQWMNEKKLTPKAALSLWDTLQGCKPLVRGDMLRLGVMNQVVIRGMNERWQSDGYREIVTTGYVQFGDASVEISKASPAQLRDFFEERRLEHLRAAVAERAAAQGTKEVVMTLYVNAPERSANMIIAMMTEAQADEIARQILSKTSVVNSLTASAVF